VAWVSVSKVAMHRQRNVAAFHPESQQLSVPSSIAVHTFLMKETEWGSTKIGTTVAVTVCDTSDQLSRPGLL